MKSVTDTETSDEAPNDTIDNMNTMIQVNTSFPSDQLRLTPGGNLLQEGRNQAEHNIHKDAELRYEGFRKSAMATAPRKMEEEDTDIARETSDAPLMVEHIHPIWGNDDHSILYYPEHRRRLGSPIMGDMSSHRGHPAVHTNDAVADPGVRGGTQIPVHSVTGTETLDEGSSGTIDNMNSMIQINTGVPPDKQRLTPGGNLLEGGRNQGEYNI